MDRQAIHGRWNAHESRLSPFAARAHDARRRREEDVDRLRSAYHVDRDRILHTKAFRRLKHKTQVFIAPQQDHFVTRMTHTLEVAEVARTITRALNLNEDLAEAAALGHDIGHGPFGHAGEEALAQCLPEGFRHNYQSVRVLDVLEDGGRGLNLTLDVLDAIERSSKAREDIFAEGWGVPATLEGQVVKTADAIAYVNHDIGDAIRAGLLSENDLPDIARRELGRTAKERVDSLISDLVDASWTATGEGDESRPVIRFSAGVAQAANELREFMFQRVYFYDATRAEAERAIEIVRFLFNYYVRHPDEVSAGYSVPSDTVERRAADYVSGMTDRFALRTAQELGCHEARHWEALRGEHIR